MRFLLQNGGWLRSLETIEPLEAAQVEPRPRDVPSGHFSRVGTEPDDQAIAGCACAGGPLFVLKRDGNGAKLSFAEAYPDARAWLKRLAER